MRMYPVRSSNIAEVGYDSETKTARVLFSNGGAYDYPNVPREAFDALLQAPSIGQHFARDFRTKFAGQKFVEPTMPGQKKAKTESRAQLSELRDLERAVLSVAVALSEICGAIVKVASVDEAKTFSESSEHVLRVFNAAVTAYMKHPLSVADSKKDHHE